MSAIPDQTEGVPSPAIEREDFREILRLVRPGARVLDVGRGDGGLLDLLRLQKGVEGRAVESDGAAVDLSTFPAKSFDYAILCDTLQTMRQPRAALENLLRLADRVIVSFPNFGHWRVRLSLLAQGRMPRTEASPDAWWATPNIHMCTLRDFTDLCGELGLRIEAAAALASGKPARPINPEGALENWRAETVLLLLSRRNEPARTDGGERQQDLFG